MTADADVLLGVTRSLSGRRWVARSGDERATLALAQRLGVPEIVARVLAARGVDPEAAPLFLEPRLRDHLPDPDCLLDMGRAAERLVRAIEAGEPVAVFADYDVDGATASSLLRRFLAAVGAPARLYVPDRLAEGYGPNAPALLRLAEEGVRLVVAVDCGTTAFDPLDAAAAAGLDVIVVDHHVAEPRLPRAVAVVNPNRLDQPPGACGVLAAVGVAFLLAVAVNRHLRRAGWYGPGRPEPDLMQWLDLVALGTVCDVAPLTGLNRALVTQGLKVIARRGNPGIAALADVAGVRQRIDPYHLGFILGPRVNAGGRIGRADLGARLLATDDPGEAFALAEELDRLNGARREVETAVPEAALAAGRDAGPFVVAAGRGWHPGVIGIVASRLVERHGRPALVIALEGEPGREVGKGSGRSVPGLALGPAVIAAREAGLLVAGGGHAMAAGFTVAADRIDAFAAFLAAYAAERSPAEPAAAGLLHADAALAPTGATAELARALERIGPYGAGHAEPRFALSAVRIGRADVVGEAHVRCWIDVAPKTQLKAIAFRTAGTPVGAALLRRDGTPLHLLGRLRTDNWEGRDGVQLTIDDAAEP